MAPRAISSSQKAYPWNENLWPALKAAWLRPAPLFTLTLLVALGAWLLHGRL